MIDEDLNMDATLLTQMDVQWLDTGDARLAYRHDPGQADSGLPGVFYLGGFQSSMEGEKALYLIEECRRRGQQITCFDYRGHGQTGGGMAGLGVVAWQEDALAILDQVCKGPQILVGSSMGGWVMMLVWQSRAARIAKMVGVASAPDFTEDLIRPALTADHLRSLQQDGFIRVDSRYDPDGYEITADLLEQGVANRVLAQTYKVDIPVVLLHGDADLDVPLAQSQKLFDCFDGADVSLRILKGGDHRLSDKVGLRQLGQAVFG